MSVYLDSPWIVVFNVVDIFGDTDYQSLKSYDTIRKFHKSFQTDFCALQDSVTDLWRLAYWYSCNIEQLLYIIAELI